MSNAISHVKLSDWHITKMINIDLCLAGDMMKHTPCT